MTDLRKRVERRTVDPVASVRRQVVVALLPGDVVAFREAGRRKWYTAPVGKLFTTVVRWNVDAEQAAKKAERKARRQA